MSSLWIVHREPALRVALTRLAGEAGETLSAAPGDPALDAASAPDVVLLGLAGDLEAELEFAHRLTARRPECRWLLVGESTRLEAARRLFDTLAATFLAYPPEARALREAVRAASERPEVDPLPLSQRPARDALAERFARGFADLELPALMRALDPRLEQVPVLIVGEPGLGRSTLARYIHHFGAGAGGALLELPCTPESSGEQLLATLAAARHNPRARHSCSLWLADADELAPAVQRLVAGWVDYGISADGLPPRIHWIATAQESRLEPRLRRALAGLVIRVPPLRERPHLVGHLASSIAEAWCRARGQRPRRLGQEALAVLREYPWPGNLRELEAVVEQSLAASGADPLGPAQLVLDGEPFAAIEASELGVLLEEPAEAADTPWPEPVGTLPRAMSSEVEDALAELVDEEPEVAEALDEAVVYHEPPQVAQTHPGDLVRLAATVGHELRNPLTAVRTFAELLPERHADPDFRERFGRLARDSLTRIERVLDRLEQLSELPPPDSRPVDVARLLEEVLTERRPRIRERKLLVLEELDRSGARALADPEQLRLALEALLDKSIELVPERGDVYLASRHHASGLGGGPSLRILLRCRGGEPRATPPTLPDVTPAANAVELAVADLVIRAQGGSFILDTSDPNETVVVIDLPAAAESRPFPS